MKHLSEIAKVARDLNIPSILVFIVFGILCYLQLQSSPEWSSTRGVFGIIFGLGALVTGVYAVVHYLISEHYKNVINIQQDAMSSLSKTHSVVEGYQQTTYTDKTNQITKGYTLRGDGDNRSQDETQTDA